MADSKTFEQPAAPAALQALERKIQLTLETKRLLSEIEGNVADLDWDISDPTRSIPQIELPARHLLSAGGKRVRPLLVCLLARALDVPYTSVAKCAVAAELVHTATLLHDDILDGATTRRGRITAHLRYDAHTAILSGDMLLSKAISDMAELGDPEILRRLANTVRDLVEGECLQADLMGKVHGEVETVLEIARRKTASLFAWCGWVAGYRAGRHAEDLHKFGHHLGIAFQLLDDVLDWESPETGKVRYQDLSEAKLNALGTVLARDSSSAAALLKAAFETMNEKGEIASFAELGEKLRALPEYAAALAWTREEAKRRSAFALSHLDRLPPSPWKDLTMGLTQRLLERMS